MQSGIIKKRDHINAVQVPRRGRIGAFLVFQDKSAAFAAIHPCRRRHRRSRHQRRRHFSEAGCTAGDAGCILSGAAATLPVRECTASCAGGCLSGA